MHVDGVAFERVHNLGQCQIVSCHDADRLVLNQLADNSFRSDAAVVRVRSLQNFIQQKQQRR